VTSFLVSVLFLIMGFLFLFVAAWGAYGLYRVLREQGENRRYLEAASEDVPPQVGHLSPALRELVLDTRLLRISLEAPLRHVKQHLDADLDRDADLENFDVMLMNLSRLLNDWLAGVDRLPEAERLRLSDSGADPERVRQALAEEGWAFERRNLELPGRPAMDVRLRGILEELARIESVLQLQPQPYR
jgi:signal transduction histidine kinase